MPAARVEVRLESCDGSFEGAQIVRLSGREAISVPFSFDLEVVVPVGGIFDPDQVLGSEVEIVFLLGEVEKRRVHGVVTAVDDLLATRDEHRTYHVKIGPRIQRLSLVQTQEVFVDLSIPDLIAQKLDMAGFVPEVDFHFALSGSYAPRELTVQYRETDLDFIARLTEHLGIAFFFEHVPDEKGDHGVDRLVFTDQGAEYPSIAGTGEARFRASGDLVDIYELRSHRALMPTVWAVQDYNYRIPTVELSALKEVTDGHGGGIIEYAPHAKTPEEARDLVEARAQERAALTTYHTGRSELPELVAGARFSLLDHPHVAHGTGFLLVEVEHQLTQSSLAHGGDGATRYENTFRAVLGSTTYRPPRRTPRPRIHGLLTAVVSPLSSGSLGASAQLDDHGRYRVRFLFDTAPDDAREAPSHPIRQLQNHAGPGYGTHFPLKPGTEVQVAFVDGDPDRPIIVGAVPNAVTPSPIAAVDAQKHRIKTAAGVLVEFGERPMTRRS